MDKNMDKNIELRGKDIFNINNRRDKKMFNKKLLTKRLKIKIIMMTIYLVSVKVKL